MLIESSTVTNCSPSACTSRSVRPRQGSSSASRPWCRCERFSFVATCTVSVQLAMDAAVSSESGVAATKLPPRPMNTSTSPSRIARIALTVSTPCSRGGSKPNSACSLSRNASGIFSQMPIVRSPCTLLCPRIGAAPAPGRPMLPRSSRKLTISRIVATALRCWVSPIAQHTIVLSAAAYERDEVLDLLAGQPAHPLDVGPVECLPVLDGVVEAVRSTGR